MSPSDSASTRSPLAKVAGLVILAGILLGAAWWWWSCRYDSSVPILPESGPAEWVIYPKAPDTTPHHVSPFAAIFRRTWTATSAPTAATLSVRAFKGAQVQINGRPVDELQFSERDWKRTRTLDAAKYLRAGENEISVTVSNSLGPPALWLALRSDNFTLLSDTNWQVSLAGAMWQKAVQASAPAMVRPGNYLFGRERVADSLRKVWPIMLFILLSSAALTGVVIWLRRRQSASPAGLPAWLQWEHAPTTTLVLILISWAVLFANNLPQIAPLLGFDRDGHLEYIDFILKKCALPLADDGWQMYQPPLFYLVSALIVLPMGGTASSDAAVLTLRVFSTLTGMALVVMIFLCLRLLFPKQPGRQIAGLLIAGFLPANVSLSHHVTNENLSALLLTVSLYFTLRVVRLDRNSVRLLVATGGFLGLSLLTKFSAVLAVPLILVAVAWRPFRERRPGEVIRTAGIVLVSMLVVCGWHFARVWHRFGTPLIGNWDPRLSFAWWQDPGYHTADWYTRFGDALICPLFSSINGFADGVYTTLWGDGLCGGSAVMSFRPQWNYDLMNWGYLLALPATILVIVGALVAAVRFLRRPTAEDFLFLGLLSGFAAGILLMSAKVPSYAQVKAFYGLPALLPLCALAVTGWDFLVARAPRMKPLLCVWLLAWVLTVFGTFWIRGSQPFTHSVRGVGFMNDSRFEEAAAEFSRALALDPNSLRARIGLASALNDAGRREESREQAALLIQQYPNDGQALIESGIILAVNGHKDQALAPLVRGLSLEPDDPIGHLQLAGCLASLGRHQDVATACVEGLRVDPFSPELHQELGIALAETGELTNAVEHLRIALQLRPSWPATQGALALALASLGRFDESVKQYQQAVEGKPNDPALRQQFAATLAMQGNVRGAVEQYYQLIALQPDNVQALNNLAWMLAVNSSDTVRNGAEAVRLAEQACELTQRQQPVLLGTLAAAYAEAGRFNDAIATAEKARDLATAGGQNDVAAKNTQLLELYRAGKPLREPDPKDH